LVFLEYKSWAGLSLMGTCSIVGTSGKASYFGPILLLAYMVCAIVSILYFKRFVPDS